MHYYNLPSELNVYLKTNSSTIFKVHMHQIDINKNPPHRTLKVHEITTPAHTLSQAMKEPDWRRQSSLVNAEQYSFT